MKTTMMFKEHPFLSSFHPQHGDDQPQNKQPAFQPLLSDTDPKTSLIFSLLSS